MSEDTAAQVSRLQSQLEGLTQIPGRLERRHRRARAAAAGALLFAAGLLLGGQLPNPAQAQATAPAGPRDPAALAVAREELFQRLDADQRREIKRFESDVSWVSHYRQLFGDQFDPAAMVAVMLGRMAKSVEAVPEIRAEIQVMNAKMGVMAAGMDSTMGRVGRMMPWGW